MTKWEEKIARVEKELAIISEWEKEIAENKIVSSRTHIKTVLNVRKAAHAVADEFIGDDPMANLFKDEIMKHEVEVRDRILDLVVSGEQSTPRYYGIVREVVSRSSSLVDMMPVEEHVEKDFRTVGGPACYSCASCSACLICLGTLVEVSATSATAAFASL